MRAKDLENALSETSVAQDLLEWSDLVEEEGQAEIANAIRYVAARNYKPEGVGRGYRWWPITSGRNQDPDDVGEDVFEQLKGYRYGPDTDAVGYHGKYYATCGGAYRALADALVITWRKAIGKEEVTNDDARSDLAGVARGDPGGE